MPQKCGGVLIKILIALLLTSNLVCGSAGDRDPIFRKCMHESIHSNDCKGQVLREEHKLRSFLADWAKYGAQDEGVVQKVLTGWFRYFHMSCTEHCVWVCSADTSRRRLSRGSTHTSTLATGRFIITLGWRSPQVPYSL